MTVLIVTTYLAAMLLASRILYGRARRRGIDALAAQCNFHDNGPRYKDPVTAWTRQCQADAVLKATFFAFVWPLTLAGSAVWCFVTASPPPSMHEIRQEKAAALARIKELEQQLGIVR
ncbi:hypothetical protein DMA15_03755 [Streptomyces sp. WAC 01529]|uniref:hypothetical protein n=1 Tax=Streptomyces sp. WAC 01529 TaxID=2203205 RepID=UPI000F6F2FF7|nr:hypothetical protein [Streptomyces sp. WAC 01529]AZM51809.1 hypothetical protein DMA15_03755 [Streptomyces sp. WAC 01529]